PEAGRQYALAIGVHFRKQATLFQLSGGCSSSVDGQAAPNCGIDCDGGEIDVSVKDAKSIMVSIPYSARASDPDSGEVSEGAKFGSDDKLFRLDRTGLQDCLPLVSDDETKAPLSVGQEADGCE